MASIAFGSLPFAEQIAFFRAKLNVLTESYLDVFAEEHDVGFMVAGANRDALVQDFRDAIEKIIVSGGSLEDFRREFDRIVAEHGWSYNGGRNWRSRVIYETNLRTSFAAGRWKQLQALKQDRPYWQYVHSDSVLHPRPLHLAWNGLVLHADDPWWHTHFPPNGWGCQCSVRALNRHDLRRLGKDGPDQAPPVDMQTVTIGQRSPGGPRQVQTPAGIDPGFGYAPGRSVGLDPNDANGFGALRSPSGVPPIRGRVADLYDAPFNPSDARYDGLEEAAARALHDIERDIAGKPIEYARAVNDAGDSVIAVTGTRNAVDLRPYIRELKGLVLTHNHVSMAGFSIEDIATAALADVREIRVVADGVLYRLSPLPGETWSGDLIGLALAQSALWQDVVQQVLPFRRQLQRQRPRLDPAVIERLCIDRVVLLLSRRYPLKYSVIER